MQVHKSPKEHSSKNPSLSAQKKLLYKSEKREPASKGSQSEQPCFTQEGTTFKVGGYQKFTISPTSITDIKTHPKKFMLVKNILEGEMGQCNSITDIGSSNGLVPFIAAFYKYDKIFALDHDQECVNLITTISKELGLTSIVAKEYSFGDPHEKTDIVFALAILHWIFSCTTLIGEFDKIIEYLSSITNKYLVIEWIDPKDPFIKYLKHLDFNKQNIKQPYTKENFKKSLNKYFSSVKGLGFTCGKTRQLYLCSI